MTGNVGDEDFVIPSNAQGTECNLRFTVRQQFSLDVMSAE